MQEHVFLWTNRSGPRGVAGPAIRYRVTYLPLFSSDNVLTQHMQEHVFLWTNRSGPRGVAGPAIRYRVTYLPLLSSDNVLTQHMQEHVFLWTNRSGPRGVAGPAIRYRVTYLPLFSSDNVLTQHMQEHVFLWTNGLGPRGVAGSVYHRCHIIVTLILIMPAQEVQKKSRDRRQGPSCLLKASWLKYATSNIFWTISRSKWPILMILQHEWSGKAMWLLICHPIS